MIAYTKTKFSQIIKIDFVRFCIVGGVGFVINFVLLISLTHLFSLPIVLAQFIGAEIALACNFTLHHNWTYRDRRVKKSVAQLIIQFHATSWPAILGSIVMVAGGVKFFHLSKLEALIISSLVALIWNFVWSKFVIWRDVEPTAADVTVLKP